MKVLVFTIGPDRYGLPLAAVTRVLPVLALKQIPLAPPCVAGLMDLHGEPVPVIDLSTLAGYPPRALWFDTRIVLASYRPAAQALPGRSLSDSAPIGLLAEHVSGIETLDPASLRAPGIESAPFLGQVASSPAGLLQLVQVDQLLSAELRALLYPAGSAA